jgi:hypothetical protein
MHATNNIDVFQVHNDGTLGPLITKSCSRDGSIDVFGIQEGGSLINDGEVGGLSAKPGFNGIAAF